MFQLLKLYPIYEKEWTAYTTVINVGVNFFETVQY